MNLSFLVNDPSWCLGSGQEIINFCMARSWRLFSTTSAHGWGQGKGSFFQGTGVSSGGHFQRDTFSIDYHRGFFLLNCLLSCMLFQQYFCCYCECYLIAIYSKLPLPQPAIFAPLCFQFSRSCPRGEGSRETRESREWFGEP